MEGNTSKKRRYKNRCKYNGNSNKKNSDTSGEFKTLRMHCNMNYVKYKEQSFKIDKLEDKITSIEKVLKNDDIQQRIEILDQKIINIQNLEDEYNDLINTYEHKLKNLQPDTLCKICMQNPKNVALIHGDSAHIVCCMECSNGLQKCPICREHIDDKVLTFYA